MKVEQVNVNGLSEEKIKQIIESHIADGWKYTAAWESPDGSTWLRFELNSD